MKKATEKIETVHLKCYEAPIAEQVPTDPIWCQSAEPMLGDDETPLIIL